MRVLGLTGLALILQLTLSNVLTAGGLDLHALWDDRCAECHGHSADFARKFLRVSDGLLQGPHHQHNLQLFISNHYTPAGEVDRVYNMLLAQTQTPHKFKAECSNCHASAAAFVRVAMVLQEGVLLSRETKQPINEFMQSHRGLTPDDIAFFTKQLNRVAAEVYGE